jgi:D-alanyl-D-alanine carboxypeptidase (penicillin-binding protein 5/6)
LAVSAGQQFTQLQLLQGALVPSANNFAEILANWDAGSVPAFVEKMNAEAQALGMTNTRYADVSGFAAGSVSTPADQLILARVAMRNPVFASLVGTETLQLPGIGPVSNVNQLLGEGGVIGIKTGFTEEAGGNLAFAARRQLEGQEVTIFGVVLGQTTRLHAFDATRGILNSISQNLRYARVIPARQPVATLDPPWGDPVDVILGEDVQMLFWPGMTLETSVEIDAIEAPLRGGSQVGWLNLRLGEQAKRVPLFLAEDLPGPGLFWRLTRI